MSVALLRRLEHTVGISGAALEWLHSYVSERYHQVAVSSAKSSHCLLERGVPQGSVLGPLLYCVYTRPIGDIVTRHGLQYHCYADDTQIYVTVEKDVSIESALARILYGIPQVTIQRLQRIQNCAARIVTRTRKYEHITPVLRLLHWLPVRQRTLFKVLVFTYCALNATAPNYLVQLINHRNVTRTIKPAAHELPRLRYRSVAAGGAAHVSQPSIPVHSEILRR